MRRLALVAPVVGLVLVGCSDDAPDPKIAPTPTDTSSAASSPTSDPTPTGPVEPTLPAEAAGTDAAAAEAFVEFYWETVQYAESTGRTDGLRELIGPGCANCEAATATVDGIYAEGGRLLGGEISVVRANAQQLSDGKTLVFRVDVQLETERQRVDMPGEKDDQVHPPSSIRARMVLDLQAETSSWKLNLFEVL